ncbi:hypothetical protein MIND_00523800 [Mycena indigotica]|uniref:Uncharacterized protein n=1 Tax=Mycena indigotica TaxID=2126181 RepID=A0A8H6SXW0_9AGAR|nr:uncharacterized protein MIND_00523800 [Mycena indigotica]KAF7307298.1 hypothetical protein MIND_00523800 [Mycena indigotica]
MSLEGSSESTQAGGTSLLVVGSLGIVTVLSRVVTHRTISSYLNRRHWSKTSALGIWTTVLRAASTSINASSLDRHGRGSGFHTLVVPQGSISRKRDPHFAVNARSTISSNGDSEACDAVADFGMVYNHVTNTVVDWGVLIRQCRPVTETMPLVLVENIRAPTRVNHAANEAIQFFVIDVATAPAWGINWHANKGLLSSPQPGFQDSMIIIVMYGRWWRWCELENSTDEKLAFIDNLAARHGLQPCQWGDNAATGWRSGGTRIRVFSPTAYSQWNMNIEFFDNQAVPRIGSWSKVLDLGTHESHVHLSAIESKVNAITHTTDASTV